MRRISKREWQAAGGCANPRLFRRQRRGTWQYDITGLLAHWRHADGREVRVYREYKIRELPDKAPDAWPILWRADVDTLTDDEWVARPAEPGWKQVTF